MEILRVNGAERQFQAGELPGTVADLLEQLNVDAATVVAEVDGQIVQRDRFAQTKLCDGQSIELIKFVPGG